MKIGDLINQLESEFIIEKCGNSETMFYISVKSEDDDPLLLDLTEFETTETSDIFVVGDTPHWFLEEPVSNKTRLGSMAANNANLSIAMSKKTSIGFWYFDVFPTWGCGDIDEGAVCEFKYVSRIAAKPICVKDVIALIRLSVDTYSRTKLPLIRFPEMDENQITPDAFFTNEQLDLFIDSRVFEIIKNLKQKAEREDPLKDFTKRIDEAGLNNSI